MNIYVFDGNWALEVIVARSEEEAWEYLAAHDGTAGRPDPARMKEQWTIEKVFEPGKMTAPECVGHYSG